MTNHSYEVTYNETDRDVQGNLCSRPDPREEERSCFTCGRGARCEGCPAGTCERWATHVPPEEWGIW